MSSSRRICAPCGRPRRYFGVVFDGWHAWQSIRTVDAVLAENFHLGVDMDELKVALETLGCVLDSATDLIDVEPLVAFCMPRKVRMILPAVSIWLACKKGDVDGLKAWLAIDGDPTWRLPDAISPSTTPVSVAIRLASNCSCRDMSVKQPHKLVDSRWISTLYCRLWNINGIDLAGGGRCRCKRMHRCITNALHGGIRRLLQLQTTEHRSRIGPELAEMAKEDDDEDIVGTTNWDLFETN
ncbi:hypothetical protein AC1031_020867 [Aphanomyces cochlioides]|nr:hypothetical protein AC1031_020867 [Aphanomyces cochlioides]